jgi:tight adherence protein C
MRVFCLALGSILALLFFIQLKIGSRFASYSESLEGNDFPLKSLYCVGFAWASFKPLALRGRTKETLLSQSKLLYDQQYADYYANVVWAQAIMFVHLTLTVGFILGGAMGLPLFSLLGVVFAVVFARFFLTSMSEKLKERQLNCLIELPEIVSTMALLINSSMVLRDAWEKIALSKEGIVYELMQKACVDMQNGESEADAIYKFGILSNSSEIKKFSSSLIQGLERGSKDLSDFLTNQSSEMWNIKKQIMLQKGEAAASKLLIPTSLIFVGILIIVISAAFGMM